MSGPGLQAVQVVGGLVPPGLFSRIHTGDVRATESLTPSSYHLPGRETVRDAANRSWTYLRGAWREWREHTAAQPAGNVGTGAARERWLLVLMRELGYGQLPALRGGLDVDGTEYPVSHAWQHVPVHLLGPGVQLDKRNAGVAGAARAPQAMVQELLNRSEAHLWAVLSNGIRLRLLRDSTALAGSAYVEFDLEAIFDGELFAEFLLLWQLCHVSRLEKRGGTDAPAADCWLEAWRGEAVEGGTRALNQLRDGVERALTELGSGFLAHPDNGRLRDALSSGELSTDAYHRALLRLVYRLLFLSVAEERGVLLHDASAETADRYARYFSVGRLRRLSRVRAGGPHGDLWQSLVVVLRALGGDGLPALGLPALAGLFDPDDQPLGGQDGAKVDHLVACSLPNSPLLTAMRHLGWIYGKAERVQPVDYRNLGAEELGSVYESLLELVPRLDLPDRTFTLEHVAGNERKTTGSYYTPAGLVSALLDSALDPLLDDAVKNAVDDADAVRRLLSLTVCDPACGSGHFLVAAARRIARRVAQLRSGDEEPTPAEVQHALREVIGSCIYGVDVNPFAAELAKVSLWMEAMEPGKPLGFLDARIRVGNSLLGTTPALLAGGVPDEAFKDLEGDDKKIASATKKLNKKEREGQYGLYETELVPDNTELAERRAELVALADAPRAVRAQAQAWQHYDAHDSTLAVQRVQADAWCAAFVWKLVADSPPAPTSAIVRGFGSDPESQPAAVRAEVARLADEYRFFHWHLEFPEIFAVGEGSSLEPTQEGWRGGFDCLLGNPPWEHTELKEQEFFAARDPDIAAAAGAKRKALIKQLTSMDPALWRLFAEAKRHADGTSGFARLSGRFPLTGRGRINTYAIFAETFRQLINQLGRCGVIVPTGIATDATTQYFFGDLVETSTLAALYDFENAVPIFEGVHRSFKFSLLTIAGRAAPEVAADFAFFLHDPTRTESSSFSMTPDEIELLNPNTKTCPVFRSRRDAQITIDMYRRVPVLLKEGDPDGNPWGLSFMQGIFNMTSDSHLFRAHEDLEREGWRLNGNVFVRGGRKMLPLYEAKMIHHFDHRWATYSGGPIRDVTSGEKADPQFSIVPRYWVSAEEVSARLHGRWHKQWFLGWRDICRSTDERTCIAAVFPAVAVGNKIPLMLSSADKSWLLAANLSSFVCDFAARQKIGGTTMNYYLLMQLPVLEPAAFWKDAPWRVGNSVEEWMRPRVAELAGTSYDLAEFVDELVGEAAPFAFFGDRRNMIRAELDAAFMHLYGVDRDVVDHILDTFPVVKRKAEARHGEFRTKRLILEVYDRMAEAIRTGEPYQTILDPPPGEGPRHPAKQEGR